MNKNPGCQNSGCQNSDSDFRDVRIPILTKQKNIKAPELPIIKL